MGWVHARAVVITVPLPVPSPHCHPFSKGSRESSDSHGVEYTGIGILSNPWLFYRTTPPPINSLSAVRMERLGVGKELLPISTCAASSANRWRSFRFARVGSDQHTKKGGGNPTNPPRNSEQLFFFPFDFRALASLLGGEHFRRVVDDHRRRKNRAGGP